MNSPAQCSPDGDSNSKMNTNQGAPAGALPTDKAERKGVPLATGCLDYFPRALAAVAECSKICNEQHNPGEPMHWARDKSTDQVDCALRHQLERGTTDEDQILHGTKAAWRFLAALETELEYRAGVCDFDALVAAVGLVAADRISSEVDIPVPFVLNEGEASPLYAQPRSPWFINPRAQTAWNSDAIQRVKTEDLGVKTPADASISIEGLVVIGEVVRKRSKIIERFVDRNKGTDECRVYYAVEMEEDLVDGTSDVVIYVHECCEHDFERVEQRMEDDMWNFHTVLHVQGFFDACVAIETDVRDVFGISREQISDVDLQGRNRVDLHVKPPFGGLTAASFVIVNGFSHRDPGATIFSMDIEDLARFAESRRQSMANAGSPDGDIRPFAGIEPLPAPGGHF